MLFICDLDNLSWSHSGSLSYHSDSVDIGFIRKNENPVMFNNLSFGYAVAHGDNVIAENSFPEEGIIYRSSDQTFVISDVLNNLLPEENYSFSLWARESDNDISGKIDIVSDRLPQPFPSWKYDSELKMWLAPISPPSDDQKYEWDESSKSWKPLLDN